MTTDPLFYRLFETSPETFLLVLGHDADTARAMAQRYRYRAIEFKQTTQRSDGVFEPVAAGLPVYFVEVQFYKEPAVYAGILAKAYHYLKQHDPAQPYAAVVLFAGRDLEPAPAQPYRLLLDGGLLRRFYLEDLPKGAEEPLGLAIVGLIHQGEQEAAETARALVGRARREVDDAAHASCLVELIETFIIYKLPHLSREEIQAMLKVHDIRETRVYQEARAEGLQEGMEKGLEQGLEKGIERGIEDGIKQGIDRERQERLKAIAKLAARKMSATEIADILGLDVSVVRKELRKKPRA